MQITKFVALNATIMFKRLAIDAFKKCAVNIMLSKAFVNAECFNLLIANNSSDMPLRQSIAWCICLYWYRD